MTSRSVRVRVEIPRWSFEKRDRHGVLIFRSPLPCPWNYGSVIDRLADDGDEVDAVVLGPRLARDTVVESSVVGVVDFLDRGLTDLKLVCAERPLTRSQRRQISHFFMLYAAAKSIGYRLKGETHPTRFRGWRCPESYLDA